MDENTMDSTENPSPKSGPNSLQNSVPATEKQIMTRITALAVSHGKGHAKTEGEWRVLLRSFCDDLKGKTDAEIAYACARWRRDGTKKFLPTSGELLELCAPKFEMPPGRRYEPLEDLPPPKRREEALELIERTRRKLQYYPEKRQPEVATIRVHKLSEEEERVLAEKRRKIFERTP